MSALHSGLGLKDGGNDVGVGGTAAEIAAHIFADLGFRAGMTLIDAGNRRHDLAGRAVAALEAVMIDEGLLHGMQAAGGRSDAFDRGDLASLRGRRKRQAGEDALAIGMDGASPALAVIAPFLAACQSYLFPQRIEKGGARIDRQPMRLAVDRKLDRNARSCIASSGRGLRSAFGFVCAAGDDRGNQARRTGLHEKTTAHRLLSSCHGKNRKLWAALAGNSAADHWFREKWAAAKWSR